MGALSLPAVWVCVCMRVCAARARREPGHERIGDSPRADWSNSGTEELACHCADLKETNSSRR